MYINIYSVKYIQKFNESNSSNKIDEYIIYQIFSDFMDDQDGDVLHNNENSIIMVKIIEPKIEYTRDFDEYLKNIDNFKEFYQNIEICLNRVKDVYPNVEVSFYISESGINNAQEDTIVREIELEFSLK